MKYLITIWFLLLAGVALAGGIGGDPIKEPIVEKLILPTTLEKAAIISLVGKVNYTKTYDFKTKTLAEKQADPKLLKYQDVKDLIGMYNKFIPNTKFTNVNNDIIEQLNNRLIILTK